MSEEELLKKMDSNVANRVYWSLTLLATIGGFLFGYDTADIGTALDLIPYHLSAFALGYLVAGASLGAAIGAILAGPLTDRYGRKSILIVDALIYAIGAVVSALTVNADVLLVARTFIGLAVGADSAIATAYIAEYAPKGKRGSLEMLQEWMITFAQTVSYIIGFAILFMAPSLAFNYDWRIILGLAAIPAVVGLVFRTRMPESPRWLMVKGKTERLRQTLSYLRINVSEDEVERISREVRNEENRPKFSPGVKRAFVVAGLWMMFQQITGINIPFYYGPKIFAPMFGSGSGLSSVTDGILATLIISATQTLIVLAAIKYVDSIGRRGLGKVGYLGMALFMAIGGVSALLLKGTAEVAGLIVSFIGFMIFFGLGVGGIGWTIQGEYFPTHVRGTMASLLAFINWMSNFALIEVFPAWYHTVGLGEVMFTFAGLSFLAWVIFLFLLPETKGMSVEEINSMFESMSRKEEKENYATSDLNKGEGKGERNQ
ncbi:sugar porter family MFS transporter [Sulfuracidifex tepidarius]|uniref:Sialic acid transporter n=1 Tax=Sulfuracidifex tepidarius TaxID=1294262 RepID=A0A510DSV9_9CREN|nr:sugar porter family MFS transporter [Sulfuracidifex tepidarius]BBG23254.1 Putative sialic acid transporter [Sulfuracidifex tepidarius]BBG26004.1 Putative sialic acid transporter [Sulfuracidifex tepidarius]